MARNFAKFNKKRKELFSCKSFLEIEKFIEENNDFFIQNPYSRWKTDDKGINLKIKFINVKFNLKVSNSHSAPIGNKTNWNKIKELPTSYFGWSGSIGLQINCYDRGLLNDCLIQTGFNAGTGGGSWQNAIFQLNMYAHDFKHLFFAEYIQAVKDFNNILDQGEKIILLHEAIKNDNNFLIDSDAFAQSRIDILNVLHKNLDQNLDLKKINVIFDYVLRIGNILSVKELGEFTQKIYKHFVEHIHHRSNSQQSLAENGSLYQFYNFRNIYEFYNKINPFLKKSEANELCIEIFELIKDKKTDILAITFSQEYRQLLYDCEVEYFNALLNQKVDQNLGVTQAHTKNIKI